MKYEGYKIGPVIRDIRKDKGLLIEEVAAKTGISVSTLGQVEQGGRNLSMKNLYMQKTFDFMIEQALKSA